MNKSGPHEGGGIGVSSQPSSGAGGLRTSPGASIGALGRFAERFVEAGWLVVVAAVPLYFNVYSTRVFEPDKTVLLRCLVLLMLVAQAVVLSERIVKTTPGGGRIGLSRLLAPLRERTPLFGPVLAFVAVELLTTLTSIDPLLSFFGSYQRLQGTYTVLTYVTLFFLVAANLRTVDQLDRLLVVALLTSLPISLYGLAQHLHLDPLPWGGDVVFRVTSTMGNAIFLAAYLIMVIPLTGARLARALAVARDATLPEGGPAGPIVWRWVGIVVGQNLALAALIVGNGAIPTLWWLAPAFVGLVVLLAATEPSVPRTRRLARAEAGALAALLLVQALCVFFTQSRGPWLGLLAGAVVFVLLLELAPGLTGVVSAAAGAPSVPGLARERASRPNRKLLGLTLGLLVAVALALVGFNLPHSPLARFRDLPYIGRLGQLTDVDDGTGRVRVLIWQGTLELMTRHPAIGFAPDPLAPLRQIVGYGPEAMHTAYNAVYPPALGDLESRNASPDRNHNDLLDHLVMSGVLGLLAYLALVVAALWCGWRRYRAARTFGEAALVAGLLASLVAHLVETQTGIAIVATRTAFWIELGLLVVLAVHPEALEGAAGPVRDQTVRTTRREIRPIAGAAPTATRPRKPPRRGPGASVAAAPLAPAGRSRLPILLGYAAVCVVGQIVLTELAASGAIGSPGAGQLLTVGSFVWLGLTLGVWAFWATPTLDLRPTRPATRWIAVGAGAAAAIAILLNLNQVAADIYHKQGSGYDGQQRFAESVRSYGEAIQLAPQQSYYWLFLGRAYLEVAKRAPATPTSPPFVANLASVVDVSPQLVAHLGRPDALRAAEVVLLHARDLEPLNPDHDANLARLYRLWGESGDRSKLDQATHYSQLATTLSPNSAQLYNEWALALLSLGRLSEAQERAEKAVALDPAYATSHTVLGDVYLARQDVDRALSQHVAALELDPAALSDGDFERRVTAYLNAGKAAALADEYGQLVAKRPSRTVRLAYGYLLSRLGQLGGAIAQFQAVLQTDPHDWLTRRNLALAYSQIGDQTSARVAAQQALQDAPPEQRASLQDLAGLLGGDKGP